MTINGQDVTQQFLIVCCTSLILVGTILFLVLTFRSLRASDAHVLMRNKVALLFGIPAGILTFIFLGLLVLPEQLASITGGTKPVSSGLPALASSLLTVAAISVYMTLISTLGTMLALIQAPPDIPHMHSLSRIFDNAVALLTKLFRPSRGGPGAA